MFRMGKSIKTESILVISEEVGRVEWFFFRGMNLF